MESTLFIQLPCITCITTNPPIPGGDFLLPLGIKELNQLFLVLTLYWLLEN